jgi:PhnB protein
MRMLEVTTPGFEERMEVNESLARMPSVIPMISYEDVAACATWLVDAFGFAEAGRWTDENGHVTHVNLVTGDGVVMVGNPSADYQSPRRHAQTCTTARQWRRTPFVIDGVLVYVSGLRAHYDRAVARGARVLSEIEDNDAVGQRQYRVEDLEGHRWMFAEPIGG